MQHIKWSAVSKGPSMAKRYHELKKHARHLISEDMSAPGLTPRHVIDISLGVENTGLYGKEGMVYDLFEGVSKTMAQDKAEFHKEIKPTNW